MALRPEWRGQRPTWRRVLGLALLGSLLLHLPLTPLGAWAGLLAWIDLDPVDEPLDLDPWVGIPVTLEQGDPASPDELAAGGEDGALTAEELSDDEFEDALDDVEDEPDEPERWSLRRPRRDAGAPWLEARDAGAANAEITDAGAPDVAPEIADAAALEAGPPDAGERTQDAGAVASAGEAPVGERSKTIRDPVALSGGAGQVADANAHVRLLVFGDRIRRHPSGPLLGQLLATAEQWSAFFQVAGLDPVRDFDRLLIAAPQLRDSSHAVIILGHRLKEERVHAAMDKLVRASQGSWPDKSTAKARVEGADRMLVQAARGVIVVGPPGIEAAAKKHGRTLKFPNPEGDEVVSVFLRTPHRAFRGIPFKVPESLKWVRLRLVPTQGGGVVAHLEAQDESAAAARSHAAELQTAVLAVTQIKLPGPLAKLLGRSEQRLVESVRFTARGDRIEGRVEATRSQLTPLLEAIANYAKELQAAAKRRAKDAKDAAARDAGTGSPADAGSPPEAGAAPAPSAPKEPRAPKERPAPALSAEAPAPSDAG
ncbi:MAG: hypothetical protein KIT72_11940 [Polyangiaceae bacterium]|nr:hypothetical protein [Polyangiaceae bacterium]MCW5791125.1 hypothetical protein [Polyangiaceae bacterium]